MKRSILILISIAAFSQCGGTSDNFTSLKKPVAIELAKVTKTFQGQKTQFAFVADQFTQSLITLDTVQSKIVDNYDNDEFDFSSLAVGGQPSAVAVDDSSDAFRIYVTDKFNKKLFAYEIQPIQAGADFVSFKPVSLGGTVEGISSRALFKESGAQSSPTMTSLIVNPAKAKNEAWRLNYVGNGLYEVTGSVSGLQGKKAQEGKLYKSNGGEVEFFISPGGEKTTGDDQFFFSTAVARPLQLTDTPVNMLTYDGKLYILTQNAPTVVVFDLENKTLDTTVAIPDASAQPTHMFRRANKIYISNINSGDIFVFNIDTQAISTISTTLDAVTSVGTNGEHLFLVHSVDANLSIASMSGVIEKTLLLNDAGNFFFMNNVLGKEVGFIPNMSGNVDVIDMEETKRIDTDLGDKSDFINSEFFDALPVSSPQLISVNATPNKTKNETWQMVFDESDGAYTVTGSKSGLQTNKAIPGETYTSDQGEISLLIRPSFGAPESQGDFFTFQSLDPIDPIQIFNQSMAVGGIGFSRISDGKPIGYIIEQTNGQVSIVNLGDYSLENTL